MEMLIKHGADVDNDESTEPPKHPTLCIPHVCLAFHCQIKLYNQNFAIIILKILYKYCLFVKCHSTLKSAKISTQVAKKQFHQPNSNKLQFTWKFSTKLMEKMNKCNVKHNPQFYFQIRKKTSIGIAIQIENKENSNFKLIN